MISAWHLAWIVPVCVILGIFLAALLRASWSEDYETQEDPAADR